MNERPGKTPWFPRKRFGYGWGLPNTVAGWLVLIGYYVLAIMPVPVWNATDIPVFWPLLYYVILTIALIMIVFAKGE